MSINVQCSFIELNHKDCPRRDTSTANPRRSTGNYGDMAKRIPIEI